MYALQADSRRTDDRHHNLALKARPLVRSANNVLRTGSTYNCYAVGRPSRSHHWSWSYVCLSVCLSVSFGLLTQNQNCCELYQGQEYDHRLPIFISKIWLELTLHGWSLNRLYRLWADICSQFKCSWNLSKKTYKSQSKILTTVCHFSTIRPKTHVAECNC